MHKRIIFLKLDLFFKPTPPPLHIRRGWGIIFVLIITFLSISPNASYGTEQKLKVVASIFPLADFSRQVGGEKVDVLLLLPPGASPHAYEPTPKTIYMISTSKIFFKIGAGLEFWADKLIRATNSTITTIECSEGIELIGYEKHNSINSRNQKVDPHIWLDPIISIKIIKKIEKAFSQFDPENSHVFKKNASLYIEKLVALDREIAERIKTFRTKEYIAFHPGWNYFSRRYGLKISGLISEWPGKEPTPKHLDKILGELKQMDVRIIFAELQFSAKVAESIAREADGTVLYLDPIGGRENRETYIDMMRYNLSVIEKAMK
jgi:zinc transport system substrate-binding protein